jgi:hypothetical protein
MACVSGEREMRAKVVRTSCATSFAFSVIVFAATGVECRVRDAVAKRTVERATRAVRYMMMMVV